MGEPTRRRAAKACAAAANLDPQDLEAGRAPAVPGIVNPWKR